MVRVVPRVRPGMRTSLSCLGCRTTRPGFGVGGGIDGEGAEVGAGTGEVAAASAGGEIRAGAGSSAGSVTSRYATAIDAGARAGIGTGAAVGRRWPDHVLRGRRGICSSYRGCPRR